LRLWEYLQKALYFVAEEMGVALKRSAFSPNIRDRTDHSCVVADGEGRIVAQAEHIPVHLGSFHVGLKSFLEWIDKRGEGLSDGHVYATNDPYIAGTHANDVMLVAPLFYGGRLVGFLSNKAHHVSIGGEVPGGLNPNAESVFEEGYVFGPTLIAADWKLAKDRIDAIASEVGLRRTFVGDISAQFASLFTGYRKMREVVERVGLHRFEDEVERAFEHSRSTTLKALSSVMDCLACNASDVLELPESDVKIEASIKARGERIRVELSSPPQLRVPFNAVFGVSFSAVATAFMFLLRGSVPVNYGYYSVFEVEAEPGSMLNPLSPAPVGFGNLETSMRVFDAVSLALSRAAPTLVPAAGSGTMMNVVLYGSSWVYYETVAGGTGGRPNGPGLSGVHSSMTNTLNTPVEIIEREYPVTVEAYYVRRGSGGAGLHPGGDGLVRVYRLNGDAGFVIVANRFRRGPWGLWGGESGAPSRVVVKKSDGSAFEVSVVHEGRLKKGDRLIVMTPGGGGWGRPAR